MGQKDFLFSILEDMASAAQERGTTAFSDFYEPNVQLAVEHEIGRYPGADCAFRGGQEYAERKMLAVFPKDAQPQNADFPLECLQAARIDAQITHRDVLGALMGLGVKREKIGDINVRDCFLQVFVAAPLGAYVQDNLTEISRYGVEIKKTANGESRSMEPEFTVMDIIVPSMRLDAVIHGAYNFPEATPRTISRPRRSASTIRRRLNPLPISRPAISFPSGQRDA
jgi:RNA-binding protein YlmH